MAPDGRPDVPAEGDWPSSDELLRILTQARELGFLGPGPVAGHVRHGRAFVGAIGAQPRMFLDLGSGGGVPGLVLATAWPSSGAVLLDASERRTDFLHQAVRELGLDDRVSVVRARAEEAAHDARWRHQFELVVARSFGPPAVVAECAVAFLGQAGRLLVSEPPGSSGTRWPEDGLAPLGLCFEKVVGGIAVLRVAAACPGDVPRRVGIPARRPRF